MKKAQKNTCDYVIMHITKFEEIVIDNHTTIFEINYILY